MRFRELELLVPVLVGTSEDSSERGSENALPE